MRQDAMRCETPERQLVAAFGQYKGAWQRHVSVSHRNNGWEGLSGRPLTTRVCQACWPPIQGACVLLGMMSAAVVQLIEACDAVVGLHGAIRQLISACVACQVQTWG
jgi:hypothetical protein